MPTSTLDDLAGHLAAVAPNDSAALDELRQMLVQVSGSTAVPALRVHCMGAIERLGAQPPLTVIETTLLLDGLRGAVESATADPSIALPADADIALITDFITESRDSLDASEAALLALDADPDDADAIDTVFRAFHTIKGTSAFLGLALITDLAHEAESLLSRARDRQIRCTGGYAGLALKAVDLLRTLLDGVKAATVGEAVMPAAGYRGLAARLHDPESFGISDVERRAEWRAFHDATKSASPNRETQAASTDTGDTVRVRVARLDHLIEMIGELVSAHSVLAQDPRIRDGAHRDLARRLSHAEGIARELQSIGLGMRMVPLRVHFQKIARLVRDLATKSGKLVAFAGEGENIEVDRTIVDLLGDPLVHMVRNSVDHGIELPDARASAGKSRTGQVRLSASRAGGNVVVELHDDGRGLDRARIVRKAVEKGLIASGDGMSDADVYRLIFAPGFSTAEQVTDVSGRGVGMDVVRRNIDRARGRVEIASSPGAGTTFTLRMPLTLA